MRPPPSPFRPYVPPTRAPIMSNGGLPNTQDLDEVAALGVKTRRNQYPSPHASPHPSPTQRGSDGATEGGARAERAVRIPETLQEEDAYDTDETRDNFPEGQLPPDPPLEGAPAAPAATATGGTTSNVRVAHTVDATAPSNTGGGTSASESPPQIRTSTDAGHDKFTWGVRDERFQREIKLANAVHACLAYDCPRGKTADRWREVIDYLKKDNAPLFILLRPNTPLCDEPVNPTPASSSWRWVQDHWKKVFASWSKAEKIEFRTSGTNDADYNALFAKYQLIRDDKAAGLGKAVQQKNGYRVAQSTLNRVCAQNGLGGAAGRHAATVAAQTEAAQAAGEVGADGMVTPPRAPPAEPPAERAGRGPAKRARMERMSGDLVVIADMQDKRRAEEAKERREEKLQDQQRQEQQRADEQKRQEQQRAADREQEKAKLTLEERRLDIEAQRVENEKEIAMKKLEVEKDIAMAKEKTEQEKAKVQAQQQNLLNRVLEKHLEK